MFFDGGRVQDLLVLEEADGLVVFGAPNVFYLTGYPKSGGAACLLLGDALDEPLLIVPAGNIDFLIEGADERVRVKAYGTFYRTMGESLDPTEKRIASVHRGADRGATLEQSLRDALGSGSRRLLCDRDAATARHLSELLAAETVPAAAALKRLRMVKTPREAELLRCAARVTESAIGDAVKVASEGVTQHSLSCAFCESLARSGTRLRLDHVSLGRSTALGNANVPMDELHWGDVIRFDVGGIVGGFASDMARCFSFGPPADRARRYYAALLAGQQAALDALRPGVAASQLFNIAVETVRSEGIPHYQRTNVGHGIGIEGDGYDPPLLSPRDETPIEAGMVLCVETPYYELGFGGLQVEDMVLVTREGPELLTRMSRELERVA